MAKSESLNEECSQLLRRMELEDFESDDESDLLREKDDGMTLDDLVHGQESRAEPTQGMVGDTYVQEEKNGKRQKRKWGPTQRMDRPRRAPEDGRTMLQKAQDLIAAKNSMKGITNYTSFASKSNDELINVVNSVNISLGSNTDVVNEKISLLKLKEIGDRSGFENRNPEVNLPSNLDVDLVIDNFPPLSAGMPSPLKECSDSVTESWAAIASKSCNNSKTLNNDRSILEC